MGLMDKFKNLFTEEVEEVKPIKKEVRHVEIKAPKKEPEEMPKKEENTISDSTTIKKEEKFVFPVYFDDKDFDDLEKPKEKKIEKKKEKPTKGAYNGTLKREMTVEEKKSFKPSLIISPVYGVLDKNYHKEDITSKKVVTHSNYYKKSEDLTIDDIRDKAYGTLEDELKNNILGNEEIINEKRENTETAIDLFNELDFDEIDKKEQENNSENNGNNNNSLLFDDSSYDDDTAFLAQQLEEQKKKLDEINDYIQENTVEKKKEVEEPVDIEDELIVEENDEKEEIVEENSKEENTETKKEDNPDLTESELFNLIDSMYDDKEES